MSQNPLHAIATDAREWLFDVALPFWFRRGIDQARGGFFEQVGIDGAPAPSPRRTLVQARQAYAFAGAGKMGWPGPWRDAVATGIDTIERHCRSERGGFVHRLRLDLSPDDARRDLYDQAFVALANATAGDALGRPGLVARAREVFAHLDGHWRGENGGYVEGETGNAGVRRQNPHMHLFEAAQSIAMAGGGDQADHERVDRLAALFESRFFDRERGLLPELFDDAWTPFDDADRQIVEPGHHFEWAWLLFRWRSLGGRDLTSQARRLRDHGLRHGIDAHRNVAIDGVRLDGTIHSPTARLWPQTERLKAALASWRDDADPRWLREAADAWAGLRLFFATPAPGAWFDRMLVDGSFVAEPARASSLYHIVCAVAELVAVADAA